ncbi:asparagine synthase-related protein [uncultured Arcticibacterium sp.]|uniref:asparagine synthetase B family protein n=1 Tax=uncultured Arcticibacterium sp. TaxID=2173042 RepID=UPI0030FB011F
MSGYVGFVAPVVLDHHSKTLDYCHQEIIKTCSDFSGCWKSDKIELRFGLFNVLGDTRKEELPYTQDQNLRIVGDVRLDNRELLIADLNRKFPELNKLYPDSYILLHAYMLWGIDCVNRISGDYSFAIWNEAESSLFCARDHFGLIPFYYSETEEGVYFSNYYTSLRKVPGLMTEINEKVLKSYFIRGNDGSFSQTIYKKIFKLPPAHVLVFKNGELVIKRYWNPKRPVKLVRYKKTEDYIAHFTRLFEKSVSERLRNNRVASQLSGGMDSSSVTAMAKHVLANNYLQDYELQAYNLTYKNLVKESEGYYANMIASHLDVELKQFTAEEYLNKLTLTLEHWIPEPAGVPNAIPERAMVKDASNSSLNVLLTGFGADVLFDYDGQHWLKMLRSRHFSQFFLDGLDFFKAHGELPSIGIKRVIKRLIMGGRKNHNLLPTWFYPTFIKNDYLELQKKNGLSSKSKVFALFTNSFWQSILETGHQGFSENRVKLRHPFFSLDLQEFLWAIPPHLLHNKYLLRLSMQSFLPIEVVRRPKTLLFGGAHFNSLKSTGVLSELENVIEEEDEFLKDKIDVKVLLNIIRKPDSILLSDRRLILYLIYVLAWKKKN